MIAHVSEAPLAHDPQTRIVDTVEALLWAYNEGHVSPETALLSIDSIIKEYRL